jgi:acyl-lipid omega-6 desaturase (Delta-12 desaturase)
MLTAAPVELTSIKDARDHLPADSRQRSTVRGLTYFAVSAAVYALTMAAFVASAGWLVRIAFLCLSGLGAGMLFIVGHDACHGSLTPHSRLNKWVGRIAFLPSLHPLAAWEYSHNALHHGWTNLRGKDPVYCPLSLDEFRALSPMRQRFERLSRSWPGMLVLYLGTIWWPFEINPKGEHRRHIEKRGAYAFDRALVAAFLVAQAGALSWLALAHSGMSAYGATLFVLAGISIPFLSFAWLMGFATYQHHTHPRVLWYADAEEWDFCRSQVEGTVHMVFPRWIEVLLHNIMEHTAHHVDTRVPLYHLENAQRTVEERFGTERVIAERFTVAGMSRTFAACQLYDYEAQQWLTFDGVPTTPARRRPADEYAFDGKN